MSDQELLATSRQQVSDVCEDDSPSLDSSIQRAATFFPLDHKGTQEIFFLGRISEERCIGRLMGSRLTKPRSKERCA